MATASVKLFKDGIYLGAGTANTAANTITSYSGTAPGDGRNIQVCNEATTNKGETYNARVISGSGTATLTLNCPFNYA